MEPYIFLIFINPKLQSQINIKAKNIITHIWLKNYKMWLCYYLMSAYLHTFLCSCAFIYRLSLKVFFTWHCFKTLSAVYFIFFPYFVVQYIFKHFSTQILYIRTITNFMQAKYHFCLQPWLFEEKKNQFWLILHVNSTCWKMLKVKKKGFNLVIWYMTIQKNQARFKALLIDNYS